MTIIFDGTSGTLSGAVLANTQVSGTMTAAQIASVANTQITGLLTASQIASVANTAISGNIPYANFPSGTVVQVATDYIQINGTRGNAVGYTSPTVIYPVTNFSKVVVVAAVDYLHAPNAYGTYGDYPIYASLALSGLSGGTGYGSVFSATANAGSQIASNQWISSGATSAGMYSITKNSGSWGTSDTFQFYYGVGPVYGGTYWGNMSVFFYLIK
jgi:hypothetical protein